MAADDLFGGFEPAQYEGEAEARWGHTPAFQESQRRTKGYGPRQWKAIAAEAAELTSALAQHLAAGLPPDAVEAMEAAERHRQHICRWFYTCPRAMHAEIATMYTDDPRFEASYERVAPGLAAYLRAAVEANAAR